MTTSYTPPSTVKEKRHQQRVCWIILGIFLLLSIISISLFLFTAPPKAFTSNATFDVEKGMSIKEIAHKAETQGIVRSEKILYGLLSYKYNSQNIYAGRYVFPEPVNIFSVAQKLTSKEIENELIRVTIPEGSTVKDIALIASTSIPNFDSKTYIEKATKKEGYMFPETYFLPQYITADNLIALQETTFEEKIQPLLQKMQAHPLSEYEILILASILEREANDEVSMKMVAGILQNRLALGMPLQADASIEYVLDKPLSQLTPDDLTIESPYNTYLNKGLPPTPIGNPGLLAIQAVIEPTPSDHLFYITAPDGTFYYAKTFAEHNQNIAKYLQ